MFTVLVPNSVKKDIKKLDKSVEVFPCFGYT